MADAVGPCKKYPFFVVLGENSEVSVHNASHLSFGTHPNTIFSNVEKKKFLLGWEVFPAQWSKTLPRIEGNSPLDEAGKEPPRECTKWGQPNADQQWMGTFCKANSICHLPFPWVQFRQKSPTLRFNYPSLRYLVFPALSKSEWLGINFGIALLPKERCLKLLKKIKKNSKNTF